MMPSFSGFSNSSEASAAGGFSTRDFLESNSYVAKFAFILMVFILFTIFLRLGILLLAYLFSSSTNPVLLDGTIMANNATVINQNPKDKNSVPILRSTNERGGLEFTWSVWMNITSADTRYQRVFSKGESVGQDGEGIYYPNNSPGLYVRVESDNTAKSVQTPNSNVVTLAVVMNVYNSERSQIQDVIKVKNIPIARWVNVMVRVVDDNVDVFVNGRLAKRHKSPGVPLQNYGRVYIGDAKTFNGMISTLQYFNYALGATKILDLVESGPNMKMISSDEAGGKTPYSSYLHMQWFFNNNAL